MVLYFLIQHQPEFISGFLGKSQGHSYVHGLVYCYYIVVNNSLMPRLTLFQQMQQVQAQQLRTQKYHSLFVNTSHPEHRNQFLSTGDQILEQPALFSKKDTIPHLYGQQLSKRICESQLITTRDDVNISRIFEEVVLFDNIPKQQKTFEVQIVMQNGTVIDLDIGGSKNEDFSLSNFSSFNAHQPDDDNSLQFRQLLENVQRSCGKTLQKAAVDSIIQQIAKQIEEMRQICLTETKQKINAESSPGKSCGNSELFDSWQGSHNYESALNNKVFNRGRLDRQLSKDTTKNSYISDNRSAILQKDSSLDKSINSNTDAKRPKPNKPITKNQPPATTKQHEKQNGGRVMQAALHSKQLRIIRKNQPRPLLLVYYDLRQIDHFCIKNKMSPKEREHILKAVRLNKTCLNLD